MGTGSRARRLASPPRQSPDRLKDEHLWGLRGSSDVICGIRATIAGVRQQNRLWNPQVIAALLLTFGTNRNRNPRIYNSLMISLARFGRLVAARDSICEHGTMPPRRIAAPCPARSAPYSSGQAGPFRTGRCSQGGV